MVRETPDTGPGRVAAATRALILILFVTSGACSLVYEVVWVRSLMTVFGVSAHAISTVLASFMGGLALGSYAFGRYIDRHPRPLLVYGLLEAGIGVYALAVPILFRLINDALRALYGILPGDSTALLAVVRIALAFAILVVPATMMGATFPVLCKFFVRSLDRVGRETGKLYFVNTAGAVIGCASAGFLLMPNLGLHVTTLVAASINGAVAVVALVLDRVTARLPAAGAPALETSEAPAVAAAAGRRDPRVWVAVAYGLSGFAALVFEVMWSRLLVLVFGSTVYSFSAMLSVFLAGLAVGGVLFARIADRTRRPMRAFAFLMVGTAFVILVEIALIDQLPLWFLSLLHRGSVSDSTLMALKFLLSGLVLLPVTILFGGTLPFASKVYTDSVRAAGGRIGSLYAANTLGAIAGSLMGGFVLLQLLGTRGSLFAVASLTLLSGVAILVSRWGSERHRLAGAAVLVAAFLAGCALVPPSSRVALAAGVWFSPSHFAGERQRVDLRPALRQTRNLFYAEGVNDTVIVNETPTERCLSMSGKILATSSWEDTLTLKNLGHLPALVHPGKATSAINIGLGIGGTVSALASHDLDVVEVAELEPKVIEALQYFRESNGDVANDPRVKIIVADGRNLLSLRPDTYDIISSDPNDMYMTGVANLYSLEFFQLARSRLKPRGVMTQWIDVPELAPDDFRSIVATFAEVFPHYTVWFSGRSVILVGGLEPLEFDAATLRARIATSRGRDELEALGIRDPETLVAMMIGDETSFGPLLAGASISTDDRPFVEFNSARLVLAQPGRETLGVIARHSIPEDILLSHLKTPDGFDRTRLVALVRARRAGLEGIAEMLAGRLESSIQRLTAAVDLSGDPTLTSWLAEAHEKYASAAQRVSAPDVAIAHFEVAHRLEPKRLATLANLGYLYALQGRFAEAEPLLEAAYAQAPRLPEIAFRLALARDGLGHAEEAKRLYRQAVEADDSAPAWLATFAAFLERMGELEESESLFRRAQALDPSLREVQESLALLLVKRGKLDEAERECSALLRTGAASADCRLCLGLVRLGRGDLTGAESELLAARNLDPSKPEVDYQLARVLSGSGRAEPAAQALRAAIVRGGDSYRARAENDPALATLLARLSDL